MSTLTSKPAWWISLLMLYAGHAMGAEPISLRAGPMTMMFEPDTASLRYLRVGTNEILRGITAPVRNQFWGTVLPAVSNVQVEDKGDDFALTFDAACRERDIDFLWHGSIRGSAKGEMEFIFDGMARSSFLRNRIGFCVLHGPSAAGRPWLIEHIDGEKKEGRFPEFISPHQPAKGIREIAHEVAPGFWAHVRMEGDTFEMEDQRNWTDASFKTYCTPLEIPYPVPVTEGTKIQQKISIRLSGDVPKADNSSSPQEERPILTLTAEQKELPRVGLQVSSQSGELTKNELLRLKALNLDHLRVDLALTNDGFAQRLREATAQAKALGVKLHVGLRLGKEPETALDKLAVEVRSLRPPVSAWLVIGADPPIYRVAQPRLKALAGKALVGAAHEDINFTQLNRVRPGKDMLELVAYGVTPQIHAFDNLSMMETLPILTDTVRSARQFIGAAPLVITPITLRLQSVAQAPLPGELPSSVDPRQPTLFTAAWTLGSFKYLAEAGLQSVTYYETVGWKGIMESTEGSSLPDKFPSKPGAVYPVYHLLHEIGEFTGGRVQRMNCSDTLSVAGLALRKGKRIRLLVANLTDRRLSAAVRGLGASIEIKRLTAATQDGFTPAPGDSSSLELPLDLPPYGIVRVDRSETIR